MIFVQYLKKGIKRFVVSLVIFLVVTQIYKGVDSLLYVCFVGRQASLLEKGSS